MPLVTEIVRSTGYFVTREPRSSFAATMRETATILGRGKVTPYADVREVAELNDYVYPSSYSTLREVALLRGTALPSTRVDIDVHEVGRLRDDIFASIKSTGDLRETAVILGRVVGNTTASLREVAELNDRILWFGVGAALREVAYFRDAAHSASSATLRETFGAEDDITSFHRQRVVVREIGQFDDSAVIKVVSSGTLREVAMLQSMAHPFVIWSGSGAKLRERFYFDDRAIPPPMGRAYTCSIITWGMSEYANYPFLTQARNLAAGQNLWRLDALNDYGVPIESWITTGRLDLGVAAGKRPTALYASGSASEPLGVVVTGDVNGVLASFDYVMDLRDQRDYRNNKTLLGKGFRSRYLQFTLRAPKYIGFRLLTAEVDLASSQRRVG